MGKIVLLDELTINQIAAGEVIERPASVVKEMIENSIDAGATSITVEIRNGGISYIRVTDNGKGIAPDDLEIAFERHATSKIRSANDLKSVMSMGFRGEALASIASIANVELTSKTEEAFIGNKIVVEGGNILEKSEIGASKGTTIVVKNLFFNTPVRYKFLKKDYTEAGYIEDVITRAALVHPEIAMRLINAGKTVIQTNGDGNLKTVIYSIYGKEISEKILNVDYEYEGIKIKGIIGKPEIARSNRAYQMFFVNKRYVRDKTLSASIEQAYKGMLPIGKYGFLVLNIEIDPSKVDVNVHPAKLEVRFENEDQIFKAVYNATKNTLLSRPLLEQDDEEQMPQENGQTGVEAKRQMSPQSGSQVQAGAEASQENVQANVEAKKEKQQENTQVQASAEVQIPEEENMQTHENKVNMMVDIYQKRQENNTMQAQNSKIEVGKPVNTQDTLKQLLELRKQLQEGMEGKTPSDTKQEIGYINEIMPKEVREKMQQVYNAEKAKDETQIQEENVEYKLGEGEESTQSSENEISEKSAKLSQSKSNNGKEENNIEEEINNKENIDNKEDENDKEKTEEEKIEFNEMYKKMFGTEPYSVVKQAEEEKAKEEKIEEMPIIEESNTISVFEQTEEGQKIPYKFIGIAFNTYIILEIKNEMYILDQHAAHERILYERVKKNYYSDEEKNSQLLLLPDIITLTHKEMGIALDNLKMFEKAGFIVEEFGENTLKLSGVPDICVDLDTKELFLETLDEINTVSRTAKQEIEERFIATVACKAAVKANMALEREEVEALLDELLKLVNPFSCPHGRPTVIKLSKYEIERKFARK